jgi:hypothetical protein
MQKKTLFAICFTLLFSFCNLDANIEDDLNGFESTQNSTTDELSSDLSGFDDITSDEEIVDKSIDFNNTKNLELNEKEQNLYSLSGNIAFKTSLSYKDHKIDTIQYNGINQLQTSLFLQLDTKILNDWKLRISADTFYDAIYDINSHKRYNKHILDEYETQLKLNDAYIQGSITENLDLKIGRQIVVWGKSDSIRVTDIINPLDNRLPGITDIEDLRLSVGMAKFDYYFKRWNLSAMIIPENRIMEEAPARSEFFAVDNIFQVPGGVPNPFLELKTPNSTLKNMQYAFAINGIFSGWDLSFYTAYVLDQKWHFKNQPSQYIPLSSVKRVVSRVKMVGSAVNIAYGSWLLKSEIALLSGIKYNTTQDKKNRLDTLLGFDYMGIKDTVLSLEVANRHIFNHEIQMQNQADFVDMNEMQTAIRFSHSQLNDTLNINALLSIFGSSWENGGFTRIWAEYDIMDGVVANFGLVNYIGGDKPLMESNKDNDRIFIDITYSF